MTIRFEIPPSIEELLRTEGGDLNREAKEVYLIEQYRQAKISHAQLREALELSFYEVEQLLRRHGVGQDLDAEEFEAGRALLKDHGRP
jgi:predicted HTH domain antitoxin